MFSTISTSSSSGYNVASRNLTGHTTNWSTYLINPWPKSSNSIRRLPTFHSQSTGVVFSLSGSLPALHKVCSFSVWYPDYCNLLLLISHHRTSNTVELYTVSDIAILVPPTFISRSTYWYISIVYNSENYSFYMFID